MSVVGRVIVHLAVDNKFLGNYFIPNLERFSSLNEHVFLVVSNGKPNFYIQNVNARVKYIDTDDISKELQKIKNYKKLIIHCFIDDMRKAVLRLSKRIEVVTIVYGHELYQEINSQELFQSKTKAFLENNTYKKKTSFVTSCINLLKQKRWRFIINKSLRRIDKLAHYIPIEYELFKDKLNLKAEYLEFNIGMISQVLDLNENSHKITNNNILLGNSGNATNNHLDILHTLETSQLSTGQKIYCPLSYSVTSNAYLNEVLKLGSGKFGTSFIPVVEFIPISAFNNLLSSCSKIILNQQRSQGGASIWSALYRGSDLYISPKNPFYPFLKEKGAYIFGIKNTKIDLSLTLTEKQKEINKQILLNYFSNENVKKRYLELIS